MIIEQAFHSLPEVLVGSGYAKQEYEAGIVSAFSLAILQELNGRSISNPIGCLCAEKRYGDLPKSLRADLHVQLDRLYSGSRDFAEFGFRYSNWIEAKFFRIGTGVPPSPQNLGSVVADIIRLVALVPMEYAKDKNGNVTKLAVTGRYFLHAYFGPRTAHLNPKRKKRGAPARAWVAPLFRPGRATINGFELDQETGTFFDYLGKKLQTATCRVDLTNFVVEPTEPKKKNFYSLILSRIESADFAFEGKTMKLKSDRTVEYGTDADLKTLREAVAKALKTKKEPKADAIEIDEDAVDDAR